MKKFIQIDQGITVNGKSYHVRLQEMPGGTWRIFDLNNELYLSEVDKETAFEQWKELAEKKFPK